MDFQRWCGFRWDQFFEDDEPRNGAKSTHFEKNRLDWVHSV